MTPATRTSGRPAVFVQQLHRAAAQRGRLDPVYQELSDHWTAILQRLYPVWALIGPGLSDPGHIEIHSRTVYLDSEALLGSRAEIARGSLERRAILRCFGVALHETMHAKHTKRWAIEHDITLSESVHPTDRQLAVDRRLLEEPRMEAHGVREFPADSLRGRFVRRALQAAVIDVILPAFAEQLLAGVLAGGVSRDLASRAHVYLDARTHYGIIDAQALAPLQAIWRSVLGEPDLQALDDLYARLLWIPDGELERLDAAACEYRRIVGETEPPPRTGPVAVKAGEGRPRARATGLAPRVEPTRARSPTRSRRRSRTPGPDSWNSSTRTSTSTKSSVTPPGGEGGPASSDADAAPGCQPAGCPTAASTGRPTPTRCNTPAATPTGCAHAITRGTRQIDKRTPGGRFDGRAYARGRAQQAAGRPTTRHPWRVMRQMRAPIQEPHVGLIIDTSGSMGGYEYALGPIAWIITDALRQIGGRCATALFGNGVSLLADGRHPLPRVPGLRTGGGTAFAGEAIELICDQLEMTNRRRARFVYVLSDGGWSDTRAGVERIRWLAELGVPTIHLSIGIAPLSVECDRITVITDPAQALDHIAADTVAALRAPGL